MTEIMQANYDIGISERWDHFTARWGYKRFGHLVEPGLHALGKPDGSSPVFVTANYTLSFDALRSSLRGVDCYILVLDTQGVNVWCAAGKGTFGTEELVKRIESTGLANIVTHRKLILPQLGAPGVSAKEVEERTGFRISYGPVRAADIPEYLSSGANPKIRKVEFPLKDRMVLIPIELVHALLILVITSFVMFFIGGLIPVLIAVNIILTGAVLFPILLPWIPTKEFASKGLILGAVMSIPVMAYIVLWTGWSDLPVRAAYAVATMLITSSGVSYMALNFTGASTYTSRTGVRKEIFRYIPIMVAMFVIGGIIALTVSAAYLVGWL